MTMQIAETGVCRGHPCDGCATCQRGRCCRRDNPQYRLPEIGEWDGPLFGTLGVLDRDGPRVTCHCCGKSFISLGIHANRAHDLTADEYRCLFGLKSSTALDSAARSAQRARITREQIAAQGLPPTFKAPDLTPEQRAATRQRRHLALETTQDPAWRDRRRDIMQRPEVRQAIAEKARARGPRVVANLGRYAQPLPPVTVTCARAACGKTYTVKPSVAARSRAHYCSRRCQTLDARRHQVATTCPHGHPWTPGSFYQMADGRRRCRTCQAAAKRRSYDKLHRKPPRPSTQVTLRCQRDGCGTEYTVKRYAAPTSRFCSRRCQNLDKARFQDLPTCPNGHPWTEGLYILLPNGNKRCRVCSRAAVKQSNQRHKERAQLP